MRDNIFNVLNNTVNDAVLFISHFRRQGDTFADILVQLGPFLLVAQLLADILVSQSELFVLAFVFQPIRIFLFLLKIVSLVPVYWAEVWVVLPEDVLSASNIL